MSQTRLHVRTKIKSPLSQLLRLVNLNVVLIVCLPVIVIVSASLRFSVQYPVKPPISLMAASKLEEYIEK